MSKPSLYFYIILFFPLLFEKHYGFHNLFLPTLRYCTIQEKEVRHHLKDPSGKSQRGFPAAVWALLSASV